MYGCERAPVDFMICGGQIQPPVFEERQRAHQLMRFPHLGSVIKETRETNCDLYGRLTENILVPSSSPRSPSFRFFIRSILISFICFMDCI